MTGRWYVLDPADVVVDTVASVAAARRLSDHLTRRTGRLHRYVAASDQN